MPYQAPKRRNEPRKSPSRSLVAEMAGLGPWFQDMTKKDSLAEDEHMIFTPQLDEFQGISSDTHMNTLCVCILYIMHTVYIDI